MITLSNGKSIPQIGVGTWTLKGDEAACSVRLAIEAGFRLIDTAQMYGNEASVGQGIIDSGIARDEIFLTTKILPGAMRLGAGDVARSIDESLAKLKTPYLDLLLIHWPVKDCVEHTWRVMEQCVRDGKARSLGVSNFNRHHLEDLFKYAEIRPVVNQIEVHPFMSQEENVCFNHEAGIQIQAWGPFGQGDIDVVGNPVLNDIARKYGKTSSQIVLRWIVQRGLITIPRCRPKHFAENMEVLNFRLDDADMAIVSSLNQNRRSSSKNDPENFPW